MILIPGAMGFHDPPFLGDKVFLAEKTACRLPACPCIPPMLAQAMISVQKPFSHILLSGTETAVATLYK